MTAVEPLSAALQDLVAQRVAEAVAAERLRVRRLLAVPALNALRCVPDGEIRVGCVVHDGATVRERLRQAYLAVRDGSPAESVSGTSDPSTQMPARPAESDAGASTADVGPSPCSQPSTPQNGSQAVSAPHDPSTNCYCGGPEEIYPHRYGTGRHCKRGDDRG